MRISGFSVQILSVVTLTALSAPAFAQAVSAPNAKFDFSGGLLDVSPLEFDGRAAATFTMPVGHDFGLQADFALSGGGQNWALAGHAFTRDPSTGLFGAAIGAVRTPSVWSVSAGPEVELYLGQWSLEGWAGLAFIKPDSAVGRLGTFARLDAAFYPTDDWRLSVGGSLLDNHLALHLGTEYFVRDEALPLALTGNIKLGADGNVALLAGLRIYLGSNEDKPLIRRHHEDDPVDRATSLFLSLGSYGGVKAKGDGGGGADVGGVDPGDEGPDGGEETDGGDTVDDEGAEDVDDTDRDEGTGGGDDTSGHENTSSEDQPDGPPIDHGCLVLLGQEWNGEACVTP